MAKLCSISFLFFSAFVLSIAAASALEFHVGGSTGWTKPTGNESETYNHWAKRNRFHIGDSVYFKYNNNDSVLLVDRDDYGHCNTTNPVLKFTDGNTTFQFDRYGYFYFISGEPGHCKAGQKLIIRVMVHPMYLTQSPGPAPSAQSGGGSGSGSGPISPSGSTASTAALKAGGGCYSVLSGLGFASVALLLV